ncbi:MAG: hypothetical protein OXH86_12745 [Acidimicrobiaceae bacterium]|nr:hypothetical protein [Acidimicrobiaceae bacterium]
MRSNEELQTVFLSSRLCLGERWETPTARRAAPRLRRLWWGCVRHAALGAAAVAAALAPAAPAAAQVQRSVQLPAEASADCAGDVPIAVASDAAAQSDIYAAALLAASIGTDCIILAGPRDQAMPAAQVSRLASAAAGGYVVGSAAAVPPSKPVYRPGAAVLGGADRWATIDLVGEAAARALGAQRRASAPVIPGPPPAQRERGVALPPQATTDCTGDVPIAVASDAAAQSDIYAAALLAASIGTDCIILAGPRDQPMAADQIARLSSAAPGGYIVGGSSAVPRAKQAHRAGTVVIGGADRWSTIRLIGAAVEDAVGSAGGSSAADLEVGGFSVSPPNPAPGASVSLSAKVHNGGSSAVSSVSLYWLRSTAPAVTVDDIDDVQFAVSPLGTLDARATKNSTRAVTAPSRPGYYYYAACVKAVAGETDIADNCSVAATIIITEPSQDRSAQGVPSVPANARFALEDSSVRVTWDAAARADYYTLYHDNFFESDCRLRPNGKTSFCEQIATDITDTHYLHTSPDKRTNYYWVTACNRHGCSPIDSANPAQPSGTGPGITTPTLDPPTALRVTARDSDSLTLEWHRRHRGSADLQLHRSRAAYGSYSLVASNLSTDLHVDRGLQPNAAYYYKVRVCRSGQCSFFSDPVGGITESDGSVSIPGTPTGFSAEKVRIFLGPDDARMRWNAVAGATYYEVFQESARDAWVSAPLATYYDRVPNEVSHLGLKEFRATKYAVRACNKAGCSALSRSVIVR